MAHQNFVSVHTTIESLRGLDEKTLWEKNMASPVLRAATMYQGLENAWKEASLDVILGLLLDVPADQTLTPSERLSALSHMELSKASNLHALALAQIERARAPEGSFSLPIWPFLKRENSDKPSAGLYQSDLDPSTLLEEAVNADDVGSIRRGPQWLDNQIMIFYRETNLLLSSGNFLELRRQLEPRTLRFSGQARVRLSEDERRMALHLIAAGRGLIGITYSLRPWMPTAWLGIRYQADSLYRLVEAAEDAQPKREDRSALQSSVKKLSHEPSPSSTEFLKRPR
ncbi:MAG: hypothetical protein HC883_02475 [Bdellovibrionaceae bacterium]|nr:hypothetical protein [Pseudobdellovibrionaceae bacterium]